MPAAGRRIARENMRPRTTSGRACGRAGACALAAALAAGGAAAQTEPPTLQTVLITATRSVQRLDESLPSATVITREDIDTLQATDLAELLGRQAGVEFARTGGPGSQASLFVRGAGSSQVLVLVDGLRLNSVLGGFAPLGGITLDAVDRIEIVRGNLSSLYGSEAIGGVVQIFTRVPQRNAAQARLEAGAGDTRSASAGIERRFAAGGLALTVAARRSAPFSAIDTAQVVPGPFAPGANADVDGNRARSGALRAFATLGAVELEAGAWGNRNDTDFDSTADGPAATHEERSRQSAVHASARAALAEGWRARLTAAEVRDRTRNRASEPFSFNNAAFEGRNRSLTLANEIRLAPTVAATLVLEQLRQRGESTAYDPTFAGASTAFERRLDSVQLGANGAAGAHHAQVNLRHDAYSDVGSATTGLAAYGYDLGAHWRVSAQVASAFRAPSFNDLYFPFFGNPQLASERARSGEVALRYAAGPTRFRASAYRTRTRELIAYDAAAGQARNIARAEAEGVELSASTRVGHWLLSGNAGWLRARDLATGERLLRRAPFTLHLSALRRSERWEAGAEASRVGARDDSDINTFARTRLAGYSLLRLFGSWRVSESLRANLRVENLFDADYALVHGYNTPRRGVFAGVTVRL